MRLVPLLSLLVVVPLTVAGCVGKPADQNAGQNADVKEFTLTIGANALAGGKNENTAKWTVDHVIPKFVEAQKAKGVTATVRFEGNGADDKDYKTKVALDLKTGGGADVQEIDGIWLGEFAQAGQAKPLADLVGQDKVDAWDGWSKIPKAVAALGDFDGKRYGVPVGTDGRVLYFNKKLFAQAGLPADWQPRSWDDVLEAGQKLKTVPGVIPIQLNAGTAMTEATTMQGVLPLLAGTGKPVYDNGKWQGASRNLKDVLGLYQKIYSGGLGDPLLQQEAKGRDKSFAQFAGNKIGILLESDYFWRSVVNPANGVAKMTDRDTAVGWAKIPAQRAGSGVGGQDFVSMSGGSIRVVNPNTKYPRQAWELVQFMNSFDATKARVAGTPQITVRSDVNDDVLKGDPMLSYVSKEVLPITRYRPGLAQYTQISAALQQATADVVAGKSPDDAAAAYQQAAVKAVGEASVAVD
ncbi:extracellular solute-binding protein [Kibdelosporangium phytohabitans]|uniref:ABC transporter substrate-binding protein n=1 Tax=Kibdelosporangium phytohabitans TaxID=860235 RepID=A0A0N9I4H3_9PSEU|nr:extracellular solute-binding protein [Kibdelosporangium phytohabitans]ALG12833.1 ABC transporter substrate-binding protein [Kibdelosporangium phytohabitans]MBE1464523.1 multiple sugar transport system substrate-binding protein [Kibdelosporangium phytohabitans]